jgi:hypothetical protein
MASHFQMALHLKKQTDMKRPGRIRVNRQRGVVTFEWMEVMLLVVFGTCLALAPLTRFLLGYSDRIEMLTGFPLP